MVNVSPRWAGHDALKVRKAIRSALMEKQDILFVLGRNPEHNSAIFEQIKLMGYKIEGGKVSFENGSTLKLITWDKEKNNDSL